MIMKNVFVVREDSEIYIHGIFSSLEKAKNYLKLYPKNSDLYVVNWTLDTSDSEYVYPYEEEFEK